MQHFALARGVHAALCFSKGCACSRDATHRGCPHQQCKVSLSVFCLQRDPVNADVL
jgi:hypothetical protein